MQSSRTTLLRRIAPVLAAAVLIGSTAGTSLASPAPASPRAADIPSTDEIRRAQDDAAAAAGLVTDIEGIISAAGEQLQEAQLTAFKAQNTYNVALAVLQDRRAAAELADRRATEAAQDHDAAEEQVGRLAGDLYRSGGMNPGIESVLDGSDPDEVMYRASTLYGLSSSSTRTLEEAETAGEAWASLTEDAQAARRAAQEAADTAEAAGDDARSAAADAEQLVAVKEAERSTLVGQLAVLRNTTEALEDKRVAGLEQARRDRDLARTIAESAAATTPAPAAEQPGDATSTPPLRAPAPAAPPLRTPPAATAPTPAVPSRPAPAPAAPAPVQVRPAPAPVQPAPAPTQPAPAQPAPAPVQPPPAPVAPAPAPPAPVRPAPAPPSGSGAGAAALSYALSKTGAAYHYAWGGNGPRGYDCSGLTQQAFASAGVFLPRTAAQQYAAVQHVPLSQLQPGDLVFWGSGADIWHVAIYLGGNRVVNALNPEQGILVTDLAAMGGMGPLNPSAGRV
ncbi:C40 family peptidase [Arthrobacter agilis]|uniref:C40 family peptidase n=1 Tax=Arthrobacter agilis TaxID=37921 RepID=UPI002780D3A6|nr:C40 family peptidase [Arthrobacter agilis]MDQ0736932.1 cell wall-associated NlpC family hydrolase [Arthrobacter agilis]